MAFHYLKYAAWLNEHQAADARSALENKGFRPVIASKAVCVPLDRRVPVGIVPPEAWRKTELCKRPLTWYWISPRAGQYLLISSEDLGPLGYPAQIRLEATSFKAPRVPDENEKRAMVSRSSYRDARPDAWENLDGEDPAKLERWMKVMGIRSMSYQDLFLTHCANHANFIEPVYFIEDPDGIVPYSIASTHFVCSACLEFFNILGSSFRRKLVAPCPGAVLFAALRPNTYLEVKTMNSEVP